MITNLADPRERLRIAVRDSRRELRRKNISNDRQDELKLRLHNAVQGLRALTLKFREQVTAAKDTSERNEAMKHFIATNRAEKYARAHPR